MNHHHPLSFCRHYKGGGGSEEGVTVGSQNLSSKWHAHFPEMGAWPEEKLGQEAHSPQFPQLSGVRKGLRGREEARGESCQTTRQILGGYAGWSLREHFHLRFTQFLKTRITSERLNKRQKVLSDEGKLPPSQDDGDLSGFPQ